MKRVILSDRFRTGKSSGLPSVAAAVLATVAICVGTSWAGESAVNPVVAIVGNHPVTEREVDAQAAAQLYNVREQALDRIINSYVVDQAAKKAGLNPDEYLDQQVKTNTRRVSETEAKQFYDAHKAQLDAQTGGHSFEQIRPRLIAALQHREDQQSELQLIKRLRAEQHVKTLLQAPRIAIASGGHPSLGPNNAPVTIVEFSDFQCPFCRAAETPLEQIRQKYRDTVKLVYFDFPLNFHAHALDAARAARCAADQNKFWQYHDALFADQRKLGPEDLKRTAGRLGLDQAKFDTCFSSGAHDAAIRKDIAEGRSLGITGTPTFVVNGRELEGVQPLPKFTEVIDQELAKARKPAEREARVN